MYLPMTDKLIALQNCNLFLAFDICSLNINSDISLFPTQRPRPITLPFVHLQLKGLSCPLLYFPINSPSVFPMFILAPVAFHTFQVLRNFLLLSYHLSQLCVICILQHLLLYISNKYSLYVLI